MIIPLGRFAFVCCGLLAIVSPKEDWKTIRFDGIGPVKVGMTLAQVNAVLHEDFKLPDDKEEQACFYVFSKQHPDLSFMVENGHLARVDIDAPDARTVQGVGIGVSEANARSIYGRRLKVEPNPYDSETNDLTYWSPDRKYSIKFLVDNGKIHREYAGYVGPVAYIEGCE